MDLDLRRMESASYSSPANVRLAFPLLVHLNGKMMQLLQTCRVHKGMQCPRLLLADDHPELLEQVAQLLRGEGEIVATVENGEQVIKAAHHLDPDLIVLDISMPVLNGIEAAHHLKSIGSRAKVIFLTMHEDDAFVSAAFVAGALGYVLKHRVAIDLIPAVREVLQGHAFASPPLAFD
jgi:DNA-binding NarL/FixJ family response regulator